MPYRNLPQAIGGMTALIFGAYYQMKKHLYNYDSPVRILQQIFNKQINSEAAKFYKEELIPQLNIEMKEKLGDGEWISVDTEDEMVVNFYYPQIFEAEYLRSCVRLEIGPLAEWMPSHETSVTPFAAEKYPDIFSQKETSVLTIDVERTFWEKLTILHKIANFPEGKPLPARYARHLYHVWENV